MTSSQSARRTRPAKPKPPLAKPHVKRKGSPAKKKAARLSARPLHPGDTPQWVIEIGERIRSQQRVTLRVDRYVLEFFRKLGPLYPAWINEVLRAFVGSQRAPRRARR